MTRCDNDIEQVVINNHRIRPGIEVRVGLEEAVIDDDIAVHMSDAGGAYLLRKLVDASQRIFRCQRHPR